MDFTYLSVYLVSLAVSRSRIPFRVESIFVEIWVKMSQKWVKSNERVHSQRQKRNPTIYSQHKKTATTEGLIELNIQTKKESKHVLCRELK